jgi:3-phenylpropionate/cinnamic acid dioxygenase small subunit
MRELSISYYATAAALRGRIRELRTAMAQTADPEEARAFQIRINALTPLLREARELAVFTAHYYDRGRSHHGTYHT